MLRLNLDLVVRLLIVGSLLLTSLPPSPVLAGPNRYPESQVDPDTATPTPLPTETATAVIEPAPAETSTGEPAPESPLPTDTATVTVAPTETTAPPAETATAEPTVTETPTTAVEPPPTATAIPAPGETVTPTTSPTITPTATITPLPEAVELGFSLATSPAFVSPGSLVTVTLTLSNPARVAVDNLTISATLPAVLSYDTAVGPLAPRFNPLLQLLIWPVPAELAGQPSLTVGFVGRIAAGAPPSALNLTADLSGPALAEARQAQASLIVTAPASLAAAQPTRLPVPTRRPAGMAAAVSVVVEPSRLQPGQSGTVLVYVSDGEGRPVADGSRVELVTSNGSLAPAKAETREGLVQVRLMAGPQAGIGQVTATVGGLSGSASFSVSDAAEVRVSDRAAELPFDPAAVIERVRQPLQPDGPGQWRTENDRYAASWSAAGFEVSLKEDDAAERTVKETAGGVEFSFQLTAIEVGGVSLYRPVANPAAPLVAGNEARYRRAAGIEESYLARSNGLQQLFTLAEPLRHEGDLVIRGQLVTRLEPELLSSEEGILFHLPGTDWRSQPGAGGVLRYSGAVVQDARARAVYAELALRRREVSLTVPGKWLAEADYPVIIDPMIGDPTLISDPRDMQGELDVAYNPDNDEYLVVWGGYDSGGASADLQGQRVAADGSLLGDLIVIAQAEDNQKLPAVTYNPDQDEYLVLWTDYRADPDGDVYGQRVAANGSLAGGNFPVGATEALQNTPDVAYNPDDELYLAVWQDRRGPAIYVYGQIISSSGVLSGTNFAIYDGGGDNQQPRLAYSAANHEFLVVWSRYWNDIYGQRLSGIGTLLDNSGTPENEALSGVAFIISNATGNQYSPAVAAAGDGRYLAVWQDYRSDSQGDIYGQVVAADGSLSGGALTLSAVASVYQIRPEVAYDPVNQTYLVVWRDDRSGSADIYGQLVAPAGTLSGSNFIVYAGSNTQNYVRMAANLTTGSYLAVWQDWRQDSANAYGRRIAGNGTTQGDSFPIGPVTEVKQYPWAAFNAVTNEYLLVWEDYRNGNADIYGQRLAETGQPAGGNFLISDAAAGGDQVQPQVAAAGADGYVVVWEDRRSDSGGDIYGQRVLVDGTLSGSNLVVAATAQGQAAPDLAYDPDDGHYLAVWRDKRQDGYGDIYGQFIQASGGLTGSLVIVSAYSSRTQADPAVVYNESTGQFLTVWGQYQSTDNYDIYGQQLSGLGVLLDNPGTPADESAVDISLQITTAGLDQELPRLAVERTSGNYLVVWRDERNYSANNYDIYGQLLNSSGVLSGSNLALTVAANYQRAPDVAGLEASQGFEVIWNDRRDGSDDLYGQRVGANGEVVGQNELLAADTWSTGLSLAARPGRPEALVTWEQSNEIYARRYSVLAADFTAAPRLGSAPLTVSFTNSSTPTTAITGYLWDFGDPSPGSGQGITSTETTPAHSYSQPGVYTVTLTVSGPAGTNTKVQPGYIIVNTPFSPETDLRGYWRLDESSGLRQDVSGHNHHLAPVGSPGWVEAGQIGSAVDLEKDYGQHLVINEPLQSNLGISGSLTLMGWVRPESTSSDYMMLAAQYQWYIQGSPENAGYRLGVLNSNRLNFIVSPDGTYYNGYELAGATALGTGVWYHVAAVFDAQAREMRVYVNGVPDGSKAVAYDHIHVSTAPFMLGANLDNNGNVAQQFDGQLDEWRVYSRALSQAEIQQVMQLPGASFTATPRQGFAPLAVTFTNVSTHATSYLWDFGDGTPASASLNPNHSYSQTGLYTVTLQASNGVLTDTLARPAYIQATDPTNGLQGYWRLNESSGARADSSGRGNQLSDNNTVASATGQVGLAADFEKNNSEYLSITHAAQSGLAITGSLTLLGWARPESLNSSDHTIFASKYEYGVTNRGYRLGQSYQNKLHFVVSDDGLYEDQNVLEGNTTLQAGQWYHVAGVFDAGQRTLTLYLNGQPNGTKTVSFSQIYGSTAPFMLGANRNNGSASQYFDGLLDEWAVYNRALSQVEIQGLMAGLPEPAPVAAFNATPLSGTAPLTVTFSNSSSYATNYVWTFGDGLTSILTSPAHTYSQAGVYTVSLMATGPGGSNILTKTNYITASPALAAGFSAFPLAGTTPLLVQFLDNSSGATSYLWNFGDGSPGSSLPSPTHTYQATGVYTVSQMVSDGGSNDTLARPNYITVTLPADEPIAGLSAANNGPILPGQPTTLTATITAGTNVSYAWAFGDGSTGAGAVVTHTYPAVGGYTAVVTATNSTNVLTATSLVTIIGMPALVISKSGPATAIAGEPITYTLTVTNTGPVSASNLVITDVVPAGAGYSGGGDTFDGSTVSWNVANLAANGGTTQVSFAVTATATITNSAYGVTAEGGVSAIGSIPVTTLIYQPPVAEFGASPLAGTAPLTVTFVNSSTYATAYLWDFGDGASLAVTNPTHRYDDPGVYTVTLTATGPGGSDVETKTDYITVYEPVVADFTATPLTGTVPLTVTFVNSSTHATSYLWDFGDGAATATEVDPTHVYTQAGVYTVTLHASNGLVTDTTTIQIKAFDLTQGLRGYWRLDESSGVRADSSGNGNDLTDYNTVGAAAGYLVGAADFERADSEYLALDDLQQSGLDLTGSLTLVGWVNFESLTAFQSLISKTGYEGPLASRPMGLALMIPGDKGYDLYLDGAGYLRFVLSDDGVMDTSLTSQTTPGAAQWYHVAAVFEAETQTMKLYLNGVEDASRTVSFNLLHRSGGPFMLGAAADISFNPMDYLDGLLDEWRVYDRALSQAEIQYLLNYVPTDEPIAGLSATNDSPTLPGQPTTLTAAITAGSNVTYTWAFGDGDLAQDSGAVVSHTYPAIGEYTAVVTASNSTNFLTTTTTVSITGRDWRLITTTLSPPVVGEHAMAYDPDRDVVVLYGGNADGWPYEDTTWELDGAGWVTMTTTATPTARYGSQMAYLPGPEGGIILFGGSDETDTALGQTWAYTNSTWMQLGITGPVSRTYHSLASNPISGTLYLFGGNDGDTYFDDLWQYENGDWTEIAVTGTVPPARTLAAMTYASPPLGGIEGGQLLLFGGRTITGTLLADLWAYDLGSNTWTELDDDGGEWPQARMAHTLTYDPATGQAVLVGGVVDTAGDTRLGDTWHYSATAGWVQASPATALPPRAYHRAVHTGDGILLFSDGEVWKYE